MKLIPGKGSRATRQKVGKVIRGAQAKQQATIKLTGPLRKGLIILIKSPESKKGPKSDFRQVLPAIYIDGKRVTEAIAGQTIEITVKQQAYKGDDVFLVAMPGTPSRPPGPGGGGGSKPEGPKPRKPKPNRPKPQEPEE
ncbi:MAG: hypothetical protein AABO41_22005, partial [Acidobacteriota bacterium]